MVLLLLAGCLSGGPREVPAAVQVAIFDYQIEHQLPNDVKTVNLSIIDPPLHREVPAAVRNAIRTKKLILMKFDETNLPDAFLSVETQAERVYPDSYVVLGLVDVSHPRSGKAFRYRFDLSNGNWEIYWAKEVEIDTDCYGNFWVECAVK